MSNVPDPLAFVPVVAHFKVSALATEQLKTAEAPSRRQAAGFKRVDEIRTVTRVSISTTLLNPQKTASQKVHREHFPPLTPTSSHHQATAQATPSPSRTPPRPPSNRHSNCHCLWRMLLQHLLEVSARMAGGMLCHRIRGAHYRDLVPLNQA